MGSVFKGQTVLYSSSPRLLEDWNQLSEEEVGAVDGSTCSFRQRMSKVKSEEVKGIGGAGRKVTLKSGGAVQCICLVKGNFHRDVERCGAGFMPSDVKIP